MAINVNLSALSSISNTAQSLSNLVLVNPQINPGFQPEGVSAPKFVFDMEAENSLSLEADITDHYAEDNKALQNHIARRPEMYSVSGFVGELNDLNEDVPEELKIAASKLQLISNYSPELSRSALRLLNSAAQTYAIAKLVKNSAVSTWKSLSGDRNSPQNKQQAAFQMFYGYYEKNTLFTVQTPWASFSNMAIKSLRATQDENTKFITGFEIQFKKMRFASTKILETVYSENIQGRSADQSATQVDLGNSSPIKSADSVNSLWSTA